MIVLNVRCVLLKRSLLYEFFWGNSMKVMSVDYSRNGMVKWTNPLIGMVLSGLSFIGIDVIPVVRTGFSEQQKTKIQDILPFVRWEKDSGSFFEQFEQKYASYPYEEYDEGKRTAKKVLKNHYQYGRWYTVWGDHGTLFAVVRWKDEEKDDAVLVMSDRIFYSNRSEDEVRRAERRGEILFDYKQDKQSAADLFAAVYPDTMLKEYLVSGGSCIFHFLRAKDTKDRVFELLGKSRLGMLADMFLAEQFEGLEETKTNPADIFGLPMKLLRYLNDNYYSISMVTPQERNGLNYAWKKYPGLFEKPMKQIDIMWLNFLQTSRVDRRFSSTLLSDLPLEKTLNYLHHIVEKGKMSEYAVFSLYENYIMFSQQMGGRFCAGRFPENLEAAVKQSIGCLNECVYESRKDSFKSIVFGEPYQQLMENLPEEQYCIQAPQSQEELFRAGHALHNCLGGYGKKILGRHTCVGFVLKKQDGQGVLIGAIEISYITQSIVQAKSFCNRPFQKEEQDYIIAYADRKQLTTVGCPDLKKRDDETAG